MSFCKSCHGGRLRQRMMAYLQWHEKGWLIINRMPAIVCDHCGDHTYDYEAVEHLQHLLWSFPPEQQKRVSSRNA